MNCFLKLSFHFRVQKILKRKLFYKFFISFGVVGLESNQLAQKKFMSLITIPCFKGATKLYFMYYLRVVVILFSTGLCKSAYSDFSFGKTRFSSFCVLVFCVSVSLTLNFQSCSMFWIECLLKRLRVVCRVKTNTTWTTKNATSFHLFRKKF